MSLQHSLAKQGFSIIFMVILVTSFVAALSFVSDRPSEATLDSPLELSTERIESASGEEFSLVISIYNFLEKPLIPQITISCEGDILEDFVYLNRSIDPGMAGPALILLTPLEEVGDYNCVIKEEQLSISRRFSIHIIKFPVDYSVAIIALAIVLAIAAFLILRRRKSLLRKR